MEKIEMTGMQLGLGKATCVEDYLEGGLPWEEKGRFGIGVLGAIEGADEYEEGSFQ